MQSKLTIHTHSDLTCIGQVKVDRRKYLNLQWPSSHKGEPKSPNYKMQRIFTDLFDVSQNVHVKLKRLAKRCGLETGPAAHARLISRISRPPVYSRWQDLVVICSGGLE